MNKQEYKEISDTLAEVAGMIDRHKFFVDLFRYNWKRLEAFKNYLGYVYRLDITEVTPLEDRDAFPTFRISKNYHVRVYIEVQFTQLVMVVKEDPGVKYNKSVLDIYLLQNPMDVLTWFAKAITFENPFGNQNDILLLNGINEYDAIKTFLGYDILSLCKLDRFIAMLNDKTKTLELLEDL